MMRRRTFMPRAGAGLPAYALSGVLPFLALVLSLLSLPGQYADALPLTFVPGLLILGSLAVLHSVSTRLNAPAPNPSRHRVERVEALFTAVGRALSSVQSPEMLTAALSRICVPEAADACLLFVPGEEGSPKAVASAHACVELEPRLGDLARLLAASREGRVARALSTGQGQRFDRGALERLSRETPEGQFLQAFGVRSCLIVPLAVGPQVLGVLVLMSTHPRHSYSAVDQAFMEELAGRAALTLDNARLRAEAQRMLEFIGVAAHDLGNPLCALQLRLRRLRSAAAQAEGRLGEGLVHAEQETRRLGQLVHNMLDLSQLGSGSLTLEPEPLDLSQLVHQLAERHMDQAHASGCTLTVDAGPSTPGHWDRLRLERVLTNLLSNAFKFGRGAPVRISVHDEAHHTVLRVKDHGIGIAPEAQQRIFGRFERAPSTERQAGVGLGLYIVRQLVQAHGGAIRVSSQPGHGTEFTVSLPHPTPRM
ncbi:GAF domain-containing sensor histidine kinase [Stigmatella sp. ncwal1]|uniref:histidine kinase n=1 Tax=Stigmatella ashevillensis TaxID=2995309 RepID=A0ABT5DF10_9BACT|nr:GAF domain-containing sensor histidine kinase [Stigmatella ashevillena]MDC0710912.1 GAF domain-containing sensor histidine kinase [Stigmatella ashevillena]